MDDRAVPKRGRGPILPTSAARIEERVVPIEAFVYTAGRFGLRRLLFRDLIQRRGDKVMRIPKLAHASVGHSRQRAAARGSPVSGEYRLPDNEDADVAIPLARKKSLGCGGPPQANGSSGRHEQEQAARIGVRVESFRKLVEVGA